MTSIRRCQRLSMLFAVLSATSIACENDPTRPERTKLEAAEAKWNATGHSAYSMKQSRDCFCPYGGDVYELTVINGSVVSAENTETHEQAPANQREWFRSVPQLFDEIRHALRKAGAKVQVSYDPVTGYPTQLWVDPIPDAVDEEFGYRSSDIRQLID